MIDNPGAVATLMEQLKGQLPLPVFPTTELVRTLRRRGVKASVDRALSIKRVFYAGDEGGIVCDVTQNQGAKEVFCRLTDAPADCSESPTLRPYPGVSTRTSKAPRSRGTVGDDAAHCRRQPTI